MPDSRVAAGASYLATSNITNGAGSCDVEWVLLTDSSGNKVAVTNTTPGGSDYGLVARIAGTATVSGTVAATQSGTWTVSQGGAWSVSITGTPTVSISGTVPISAASLPLPSGAATETSVAATATSVAAIDTSIGAKADAAATTDTGTFSLIALVKRLLAKFKLEDDAHASGDPGIQALAVRKDAAAAIAGTDGDYSPMQVNANGWLRVTMSQGTAIANSLDGAATTWETLVPAPSAGYRKKVNIRASNTTGATVTFRAALVNGSGTPSTGEHFEYDASLIAGGAYENTDIIVPAGYTIRVHGSAAHIAWVFDGLLQVDE